MESYSHKKHPYNKKTLRFMQSHCRFSCPRSDIILYIEEKVAGAEAEAEAGANTI
jgi:hypothetical protein